MARRSPPPTCQKTVTPADLDAGRLVYVPPAGESGDDLTSFTFRVNDGTSDSTLTYTMTVDVVDAIATDIDVAFAAADYTATEGGAAATVEVTLSRAPGAAVEIPLAVVSRNWGAVAGDHSAIPAMVTFGATETSKTFTVTAPPTTRSTTTARASRSASGLCRPATRRAAPPGPPLCWRTTTTCW